MEYIAHFGTMQVNDKPVRPLIVHVQREIELPKYRTFLRSGHEIFDALERLPSAYQGTSFTVRSEFGSGYRMCFGNNIDFVSDDLNLNAHLYAIRRSFDGAPVHADYHLYPGYSYQGILLAHTESNRWQPGDLSRQCERISDVDKRRVESFFDWIAHQVTKKLRRVA
jgi:hypothetical protein